MLNNLEIQNRNKIKNIFIIPSYRENNALPIQLDKLVEHLSENDLIIIADDSEVDLRSEIVKKCEESLLTSKANLIFSFSENRSGRGFAVRRSMVYAIENYPNLVSIIESDADGSHRAQDIIAIRDLETDFDLVIGSRYLPESKIIGWSTTRKFLSKFLNFAIPKILKLPISDVTNGLRKYSLAAVKIILSQPPLNSGFIYLSEQALLVKIHNLEITEFPIIFVDRTHGKSTVRLRELMRSIIGVFRLAKLNRMNQN